MKTAHLNVIKGLNFKYLFIKFDSKILQALQIPVWETFVSKNLPDNCIRTCSLSRNSRALRTTGWFLIRKGLLDLWTHWMIFELRCYKKQWNTCLTFLFIPAEILPRDFAEIFSYDGRHILYAQSVKLGNFRFSVHNSILYISYLRKKHNKFQASVMSL